MKSKLSVAIAAAGCVLAVSPANAISVTSHRGATTSSVPGAVLFDDFDSVQKLFGNDADTGPSSSRQSLTDSFLQRGGDWRTSEAFTLTPGGEKDSNSSKKLHVRSH